MFDLFVQIKVLVEWSQRSDWFDVDGIPSLTRSDNRWLLSSIALGIESIRSATDPTLDDKPFVSLRSTLSARRLLSEDLRVALSTRPRPSAVFLAAKNVIRSLEKKFFLTEKEICVFSSLCFTSTFVFRLLERLVEKIEDLFVATFQLLFQVRHDVRFVRQSILELIAVGTTHQFQLIGTFLVSKKQMVSLFRTTYHSLVRRGSSYTRVYRASLDHPEKFWSEQGEKISSFQRWKKMFVKTNLLRPRWFHDGLLNMTYNCLDRHSVTASHRQTQTSNSDHS